MDKKVLSEINNYRNLMGLQPLNEVIDIYDNIEFSDYIVGKSTPSKDKIDTTLLNDVEKASQMSEVKVVITTAVSGHNPGTRHGDGYAIDIAMVYDDKGKPQGFSGGIKSAKEKGIYDKIMSFVSALQSLGYKKNVKESDYKKVVLTFGYPGHDNHIHVSNVENREPKKEKPKSEPPVNKPEVKKTEVKITPSLDIVKQPVGDPYEYKKTKDGKYYTKKKTSDKWIDVTGTKFEEAIKLKVFKEL